MKEITIVAFNYGKAGQYINGPGICLVNFVNRLRKLGCRVNVFSELISKEDRAKSLSNPDLEYYIKKSDIFHHWSGISPQYIKANQIAKEAGCQIVIGPNVLDLVEFQKETSFLEKIAYSKILTVNQRLKYLLSEKHQIDFERIDLLMTGPDLDLWKPIERSRKILWKGNSKHFVKGIDFALELQKKLPKYQFEFIGYPHPYHYLEHIEKAKRCGLYVSTSLSETMGMALLESWASGLPSITHPKIYLHGINYETGIITNRTLEDYSDAIREILENPRLHRNLSDGAIHYIKENFSKQEEEYLNRYVNG